MACPHGKNSTPLTCSQCLGATPTKLEVVDGWIFENGKPKISMKQLTIERQNEEEDGNIPHRRRVCGRCHLPGHSAATCTRPTVLNPEDEVAEEIN